MGAAQPPLPKLGMPKVFESSALLLPVFCLPPKTLKFQGVPAFGDAQQGLPKLLLLPRPF